MSPLSPAPRLDASDRTPAIGPELRETCDIHFVGVKHVALRRDWEGSTGCWRKVMIRQLLAVLDAWFYGAFDRISALFADDLSYPDDTDILASPYLTPALVPVETRPQWWAGDRPLAS
jgi:hypothetical protein